MASKHIARELLTIEGFNMQIYIDKRIGVPVTCTASVGTDHS
jgi:hypothetical protein